MKKNIKLYAKRLVIFIVAVFITIITYSSFVIIEEKKGKIVDHLKFKFYSLTSKKKEVPQNSFFELTKNKIAKDIQKNGGYILFFRHAHREKWIDVNMYDAYDATNNLKAEDEYYKYAVCLSDMGKIQAKMMGDNLKMINIPIGKVYTSPSCRARQTADLAFGGYDEIKHIYLHYSYYEDREKYNENLKKELLKINIPNNKNVIISGHNSVINEKLFDKLETHPKFDLEEGGFYAFKKIKDELIFILKFTSFELFSVNWYPRPKD